MSVQALTLRELSDLLPRLQVTVEKLVGAVKGTSAPPRRGRKRSAPRVARKPAADLQSRVVLALKKARPDGVGLAKLAASIRADRKSVAHELRALRAGRKARVRGEARAARWFAT